MTPTQKDLPLHALIQGEGLPVILIHGIASSSSGWSLLLPDLVQAGFRAAAIDLMGHGESHKPGDLAFYHVDEVFLRLAEWIDGFALDRPFFLVGHSLGGYLSLRYSLENPRKVHGMTLINPLYSPAQLNGAVRWMYHRPEVGVKALRGVSEKFLQASLAFDAPFSPPLSLETRRQAAIDMKRAAPEILHILTTIPDLTPRLSQVSTPTQVIWGSRDPTLRPASFPRLIESLPEAAGQKIEKTGHLPHLTKAKLVNPLIINFFRSLASI